MMDRRRFLAVAACFAGSPALAQRHGWTGRAFGAEASIELHGPSDVAARALETARALIAEVEGLFSLYDPRSELALLNAHGARQVPERFMDLMQLADAAYRMTDGLFDPTVQPLWRALVDGGDVMAARARIGWDQVTLQGREVTLGQGQALTFNGIAQGFATDLVSDMLRSRGFERTLVNIGEHRGTGRPWRLGVSDPIHGMLAMRTIENRAVATSSPMATPVGSSGHIVHPVQLPRWSTVSVEADTAAMADALSTGLVLADLDLVKRVSTTSGVHRTTLVDPGGDLITF
ncbi:FAD:protein FMN transferase [Tateyamaria omphalii]|uniref:FAD:protein FMN transferase n=1 Tax=Tateyamaria omphalii TaxID=299262 RepID=UPI001C997638|nr:FAD:protein FMN transferase [Tateyamaria omphalii]MBY5935693.1 FAD:protein FMN transferase [Tateyamaria omphalii]